MSNPENPSSLFNPFAVLNLKASFDLDLNQLEANYLELMKQYHPDRIAQEPAGISKLEIIAKSSEINDAYSLLKDPLKRGISLLQVKSGIDASDERDMKLSPMFLMKQFELRQAVDNLKHNFDFEKFINLENQCAEENAANFKKLEQAFIQAEDSKDYAPVLEILKELMFYKKLQAELDSLNN